MKLFAICFIALVAVSSAATMYEEYRGLFNFSEKRSIMFVMAQVEAHLRNGSPMDAITRLLSEYQNQIQKDQLAHNQLYEKQLKECKDEFKFRKGEIGEADEAIKEAQGELDSCNAQLTTKKNDLDDTKKQLKDKNAQLINLKTTRQRETYAYTTFVETYAILHPAILEALELLEKLFSGEDGSSFLQISRHANKMLKNAIEIGQSHHMAPVLGVLAQIASESESEAVANTELLDKLRGVFNTFKKELETKRKQEVNKEETAIREYESDLNKTNAALKNLGASRATIEEQIEKLKKCVMMQNNVLSGGTRKKDRNTVLFTDAKNMCNAMKKQYDSAKEGRKSELELVRAIEEKVRSKIKSIGSSFGSSSRGGKSTYKRAKPSKFDKIGKK